MSVSQKIELEGPFLVVKEDGTVTLQKEVDLWDLGDQPLFAVNVGESLSGFTRRSRGCREFTTAQVCQGSLVTNRQLEYWVNSGILRPDDKPGTAKIVSWLWSRDEAFLAGLCATLRRSRQTLPVLQAVADLLRAAEPAAFGQT